MRNRVAVPHPLSHTLGPVTPARLSALVLRSVDRAVDDGRLPAPGAALPDRVVVEAPPARGKGDYATAAPLRLAPSLHCAPGALARLLRGELAGAPGVGGVEISGLGFLNVTLDAQGRTELVRALAGDGTAQPSAHEAPAADIANWSAVTGDDTAALAVRTEASSPLFRVQYACSRAHALLRSGRALDVEAEPGAGGHAYSAPQERALLALLADGARHLQSGQERSAARHLESVAEAFHRWSATCPTLPLGDEKPGAAHRAGLALAEAVSAVLVRGLSQLGVTAPVLV